MARLSRIVILHQPLHIMHRGNNRQNIFESDEDMGRIKEDIKVSLSKSGCCLHAYVIITNHLHLLITPQSKVQLAAFMQSVANRYVRYFNAQHQRSGTIWEGRFKSCLVDSDHYLFVLYKYIEMNPVKAGMVEDISEYRWSSYLKMFKQLNTSTQDAHITQSTLRGEVYGSESFHQKISALISRTTKLTSHGGDRKSEAYHNQVG